MKIYAAEVCGIPEHLSGHLFDVMDRKRVEKVRVLRDEKERLRSICAGLLLRYAFLQEGYDDKLWRQMEISEGSYGKPRMLDCKGFFYSLSHSGEWVLCAVDDAEIGADIQKADDFKIAVAKRFYASGEYDRLLHCDFDKNRQKAEFYRMWTAKESCVKLTGRGIGAGIGKYVTDSEYTHIVNIEENSQHYIKLYECISGYMICVCSERECFPENIILTNIVNDVLNMEERKTC